MIDNYIKRNFLEVYSLITGTIIGTAIIVALANSLVVIIVQRGPNWPILSATVTYGAITTESQQ